MFSSARGHDKDVKAYENAIVSVHGGKIKTDTPVSIDTVSISTWENRSIHTLVVVGGNGAYAASQDRQLIEKVTRLSARSNRICSVCSGAFVLAAAGILDNRRAVTHWEDCSQLAKIYPQVHVETNPIFIKDGDVWTSAGITAGIDLALALVAEDFGRANALKIARDLVTYMMRPGGQSQFSPALDLQILDTSGRFNELHSWIANNLHRDLRVDQLADRVNMSSRNFSRVYTSEIGQTPAKTVVTFRLEAARRLLEVTSLTIKIIAMRCGFDDDERMRRAFMRTMQISPIDYRRRFKIDVVVGRGRE